MTTEDDFQAALDANPEDFQTRLVFADWLQERGDPRADGYRVLGALRLYPWYKPPTTAEGAAGDTKSWFFKRPDNYNPAKHGTREQFDAHEPPHCRLPATVAGAMTREHCSYAARTRRELEDRVANVIATLPLERRAELLAVPTAAPRKPTRAKPKKEPKPRGKKK